MLLTDVCTSQLHRTAWSIRKSFLSTAPSWRISGASYGTEPEPKLCVKLLKAENPKVTQLGLLLLFLLAVQFLDCDFSR